MQNKGDLMDGLVEEQILSFVSRQRAKGLNTAKIHNLSNHSSHTKHI
jgi:hypothetical protein